MFILFFVEKKMRSDFHPKIGWREIAFAEEDIHRKFVSSFFVVSFILLCGNIFSVDFFIIS